MREKIKVGSAMIAITSAMGAIVFAGQWLGNQDIIMGHSTYQEPHAIINATWLAGLGLLATVVFGLASFTNFFGKPDSDENRRSRKHPYVFSTVLFVTSVIFLIGYFEVPVARQHLLLQRILSGEMSDDELREATKSPRFNVKSHAMDELRKRGRVPPLWD